MSLGTFTRAAITAAEFSVVAVDVNGAVTSIEVTDGGANYFVGDVLDTFTGSAAGTGLELTVDSIDAGGAITGVTIGGASVVDYVALEALTDGTTITGLGSMYYDHNQYEAGGIVSEYTTYPNGPLADGKPSSYTPQGSFANYDAEDVPTIKVVRPADQPQLIVPRWEPTIVDGDGVTVIGNTIRAEDIYDEDRCIAAGFTWETDPTNLGLSNYGYCKALAIVFDAGLPQTECEAGGFYYDNIANTCVDPTVETDIQAYIVAQGYDANIRQAEAICTSFKGYWNGTVCSNTFPTTVNDVYTAYTDQDACVAAKGIWIAGLCYNPTKFGNGQGGDFSDKVGSHNL